LNLQRVDISNKSRRTTVGHSENVPEKMCSLTHYQKVVCFWWLPRLAELLWKKQTKTHWCSYSL